MGDATMTIRNKKGSMVLRDIMFMVVIFAVIMALASLFVSDMATEYENSEMKSQYYSEDSVGTLGDTIFVNVSSTTQTMKKYTEGDEGLLGSFTSITGIILGAPKILFEIIKTPVYIGKAITTMMFSLNLPSTISSLLGNAIIILFYMVIIFVIISALLKGGKV